MPGYGAQGHSRGALFPFGAVTGYVVGCDVGHGEQFAVDLRLPFPGVDYGAMCPFPQRFHPRGVVHHRSTRGVDEDGAGF